MTTALPPIPTEPVTPPPHPEPGKVLMLEYYHITYNFVIKLAQQ